MSDEYTFLCSACNSVGRAEPATHFDSEGRDFLWCDVHAWSGDYPFFATCPGHAELEPLEPAR